MSPPLCICVCICIWVCCKSIMALPHISIPSVFVFYLYLHWFCGLPVNNVIFSRHNLPPFSLFPPTFVIPLFFSPLARESWVEVGSQHHGDFFFASISRSSHWLLFCLQRKVKSLRLKVRATAYIRLSHWAYGCLAEPSLKHIALLVSTRSDNIYKWMFK